VLKRVRARNMYGIHVLTVIPRDNSRNDAERLVPHLGFLVEHDPRVRPCFRPKVSLAMLKQEVHLGARCNDFAKGCVNDCRAK
jgi:hypothetical protein